MLSTSKVAFSVLMVLAINLQIFAGVKIASTSRADCEIIVATDASAAEKHAADELARFLEQASGAKFAIKTTSEPGSVNPVGVSFRLLVGPGAARLAAPGFSNEGLGEEGLIIRTVGNDMILAGGRPRGTLYAVYTFLEEQVGCRWWTPTVMYVPPRATLAFDKLDVRINPRLEYREPFWYSAFDGDWAARNRCNGTAMRLDEKHGGKHIIEGFVHTFYPLIPPDKYFADHPDWFSEIQGKRKHEQAQLCLTNDELRAELVRNLKERLAKNPSATMASVSQNDWIGNCQCAKCAAIDKEEGTPAGSLLRFVNAVAEEIEKDYPKVAISTLAYQYTRKPPLHVRPRPNVVVWLCSIECSFSKPLIDPRNEAFRKDIEGWSKICDRLYVWDYTTNFRHYVLPHPNLRVLGPNVAFFADHHVRGLFEQGAYHTWGAEMMELRAWVLAKMLWDPSLDADKLIEEFIAGYYGPAGPHIREYLKTTHGAVDVAGDPLGCFSGEDAKFLSLKTLAKGLEQLKQAEQAAGDDSDVRHRVQVARLPVLYTFIIQWDRLRKEAQSAGLAWPVADSKQAVYDQFMRTAEAIKMTHVAEGRGIDWLKTQVEATK
jgi:hypothetical protein